MLAKELEYKYTILCKQGYEKLHIHSKHDAWKDLQIQSSARMKNEKVHGDIPSHQQLHKPHNSAPANKQVKDNSDLCLSDP